MSNNAKAPKGYNNKSVQDLQQESQRLLFALGQAQYNERFSQREQDRLNEELEEMEAKLLYAQRAEQAAKREEKDKAQIESEVTAGASSDEAIPSTGA